MFVCFEGIDGAGKSTQAGLLYESLSSSGLSVELVRDPGTTRLGQSIRQLILDCDEPITAASQALLFSAARAELSNYVQQRIDEGKIVICDRWLLSTLVYQAGISEDLILAIFNNTCLIPDMCVLLDIDPAAAESRRSGARRKDRYERATLEDKEFRRAAYLKYSTIEQCARNVQVFDASTAETDLHGQIVEAFFSVNSQQWSLL
jgi:dTMP kinase